jgi:misacylated tRNA(Ala) deacylase
MNAVRAQHRRGHSLTVVGTLRLELGDPTLREWDAIVLASGADGVVLDRSAFYPGGGGQPPDEGVLIWGGVQTRIAGARKTADDVYLVPVEGEPLPPPGTSVRGALDDTRRSALMRTHSALHLLNGVVWRDFGLLVTSAGMEPLEGRMDFDLPQVPEGFREHVQEACNAEITADRSIVVRAMPREEAFAIDQVARAARDLVPPELQEVRIVEIVGLDVEADGGTHVASTKQIGGIEIVKVENKGKGFRRLRVRLPE